VVVGFSRSDMRSEVWGGGFGPGVGGALHRVAGDTDGVLAEPPESHDVQAEAEHFDAVFQGGFAALDAGIPYLPHGFGIVPSKRE
jgi:hypothetical protein